MLTFAADALLQIANLGEGRVLPAGAEEIAELVEDDAADAASVEERERLLVVGGRLRATEVRSHCSEDSNAQLLEPVA